MRRKPVRIVTVVTVLSTMLVLSAVASAAVSLRPSLGPPNGKRVHAGKITLEVKDPAADALNVNVFVAVGPTRKSVTDNIVNSVCDTDHRCDYLTLEPWRHHPGWWIYTAPRGFSYPGYWATTPGKLYWQATHPDCFHFSNCEANSKIGSFRIVR